MSCDGGDGRVALCRSGLMGDWAKATPLAEQLMLTIDFWHPSFNQQPEDMRHVYHRKHLETKVIPWFKTSCSQ